MASLHGELHVETVGGVVRAFPFETQQIDIGHGGPFCTFLDPKSVDVYEHGALVR